ncbi:MAG: 50S ribosomal protein L6 [Phototrophicales bacterium]|nr:MAG: 50S ribosomal protein L6 [Phototrophicales bacterium]RMG70102.1 MAG: 50S ribosomal protein L6 [Chloroflexota bacterium]
MSRIGKKPIVIPAKVEVKIDGQEITVKGPKGQLSHSVHPDISVKLEDGQLLVTRPSDARQHRALHGLTRALLANMVTGVSEGFRRTLLIEGVGYQADLRGKDLVMKLGYSHEIVVNPPDDNTSFDVPKDSRGRVVYIDGIDKQVVGQIAANIRELRPPEPYKGKGIRYSDEIIRRKAGKTSK